MSDPLITKPVCLLFCGCAIAMEMACSIATRFLLAGGEGSGHARHMDEVGNARRRRGFHTRRRAWTDFGNF